MNHTITIIISGCNILNPIRTISAKILPFYHLIQFDLVVVLTLIFEYDVFRETFIPERQDETRKTTNPIRLALSLEWKPMATMRELYRFHQFLYCISFLRITRTISNIIIHIYYL